MPDEDAPDAATATILETLDAARARLTDAEAKAKGAKNDAALAEIIRVVRAQNRILRHLARIARVSDDTLAR